MPYVQRDPEGRIVAVAAAGAAAEWVDEGSPELHAFLLDLALDKAAVDASATRALNDSDLAMIRVVEDVIELLIQRNLLRFSDMPEAAQEKLMARRSLRQALNPLTLMGGDDGIL